MSAVNTCRSYLDATGLGKRIDLMLTQRVGRHRSMPSDLFMLGFYLDALKKGHSACILDAARALYSIPAELHDQLAVPNISLRQMYARFERWFATVTDMLTTGWPPPSDSRFLGAPRLTIFSVCQEITRSPLTATYLQWPSIAIDGTDFPTFGNLHISHDRLVLDGDAIYDDNGEVFGGEAGPAAWDAYPTIETPGGARVLGIGADGRAVHTLDTEARAGYRTGTLKKPAGKYEGYEITSAAPMPVFRRTNQVTDFFCDAPPPPLFLGFNLTPAGTHRGQASLAVVEYLDSIEHLREVAADRGITYMTGYAERLRMLGIQSVHTLHSNQRKIYDGPEGGIFIDQTLLSDAVPPGFLDRLPLPPIHGSAEVRRRYETPFNDRARWRWRNHAGPDVRGSIRLACPICTSPHVRCPSVPSSMRLPRTAPLSKLPNNRHRCCSTGTVTFSARDYPLWMGNVVPFTSAHFMSYGRRNAAETVNAYLHGLYVNVDEKWAETFGTAKRAFLLSFTLAAINHQSLAGHLDAVDVPARRFEKRLQEGIAADARRKAARKSGASRTTRT